MHVFRDVWTAEVHCNCVFFSFFFLFFGILQSDLRMLVDLVDALVDVGVFKEYVQEEAGLFVWAFADFAKLNLLNGVF